MTWPYIIAALAFALALLLHFLAKRARSLATLMVTTDTKRIGDIAALVGEVRRELPGDTESGYAEYCELKGELVSDEPVIGELSGSEVGLYEVEVVRVIETRRERRRDDGSTSVTWHKSEETLTSNRREAITHIDDGSGRVRLLPRGAELRLDKLVDRFEPPSVVEQSGHSGLSLRVGSFQLALTGGLSGSHRRTLGYRFTERALPINRPVYALGEVADTSDGLVLRKPSSSDEPFLVSLKSEGELISAKRASAKWLRVGSICATITAIALVVMGLLK